MNPSAAFSFAVFGALAVGDWVAVSRSEKKWEYALKPLALAALLAASLLLDPIDETRRAFFVAALVLSLAGDVFLMLPRDLFVAGLGSFFLAHVAYIGGFIHEGVDVVPLMLSLAVIGLAAGSLGIRIVQGARRAHARLTIPVGAYIVMIALMGALAVADGSPVAASGALLFLVSDALIGWTRFVHPLGWAPVGIMATYHVAQSLLVVSLVA